MTVVLINVIAEIGTKLISRLVGLMVVLEKYLWIRFGFYGWNMLTTVWSLIAKKNKGLGMKMTIELKQLER